MKTTGTVRQGGQDAGGQKDEAILTDDRLNKSAAPGDENAGDQKEELPWPDDRLRELVVEAKTGDREAVNRLLEYPRVKKMIRVVCVSRMHGWKSRGDRDVEDLKQEVRIRVWQAISTCQAKSEKQFSAWLCMVARNKHIDTTRPVQKRDANLVEIEALDELICVEAENPEDQARLAESWDRLSDRKKRIFELRLEGLTYEQIGAELPDQKSKSQVQRDVIEALRELGLMKCPVSKNLISTQRVRKKRP